MGSVVAEKPAGSVLQRRFAIIALLVTSISIVLAMVGFLAIWHARSRSCSEFTGTMESNQICGKCSTVNSMPTMPTTPTETGSWRRISDSCDLCCTRVSGGSQRLLQIVSIQQMSGESDLHLNRPAAHMTLDLQALKEQSDKLQWVLDDGLGTAFLSGGTRYVNNTIQVNETGNYVVYSYVTFSSAMFDTESILNHYVYRHRPGREPHIQLLLMGKQTRGRESLAYQPSSLLAVLHLEADDMIETKVTDPSAIYASTLSNYMGLYKI